MLDPVPAAGFTGPVVVVYDPLGDYAALSNFAEMPMTIDEERWSSVEHYFQAAKFTEAARREEIRQTKGGAAAKALAWREDFTNAVRADWDEVRVAVMSKALNAKFRQWPVARETLGSTWPMPIVELSNQDGFWGRSVQGAGLNTLGNLLCDIRAELFDAPDGLDILAGSTIGPTGGVSRLGIGTLVCSRDQAAPRATADFAYPGFVELGIPELMAADDLSEGGLLGAGFERRARALDRKYAQYAWFEDARSAVPGWLDRLFGVLSRRSYRATMDMDIIAVGTGSGSEAQMLWSTFGARATLVDLGHALVKNAAAQAPLAKVLRLPAERLASVSNESADGYFSLRTFDSANFGIRESLDEARRVLKPAGIAMISVSNAYLGSNGRLIHGQIGADRKIDRVAPLRMLGAIVDAARETGFIDLEVVNLESEICLVATRG